MEEDPSGRFICEACGKRYDDGGDRPRCDGEPLLDLAQTRAWKEPGDEEESS